MEKLRTEKKDKLWQRKSLASYGSEEAEDFYLNLENGETQWDRPEEYFSDEDETEEVDLDTDVERFALLTDAVKNHIRRLKKGYKLNEKQTLEVKDCVVFLKRATGENGKQAKELWISTFQAPKRFKAFKSIYNTMKFFSRRKNSDMISACASIIVDMIDLMESQTTQGSSFTPTKIAIFKKMNLWTIIDAFNNCSDEANAGRLCELVYWTTTFQRKISINKKKQQKMLESFKILLPLQKITELQNDREIATGTAMSFIFGVYKGSIRKSVALAKSFSDHSKQSFDERSIFTDSLLLALNKATYATLPAMEAALNRSQAIIACETFIRLDLEEKNDPLLSFFGPAEISLILDSVLQNVENVLEEDKGRIEYLRLLSYVLRSASWKRDETKKAEITECLKNLMEARSEELKPCKRFALACQKLIK